MSAYKERDEMCDDTKIVMLFSNLTYDLVYFFCPDCQEEEVHPLYAFNVDYFRMARETVIEIAEKAGKPPRATIPHSRIKNKVCTSPKSLAEHLFNLEVSDE